MTTDTFAWRRAFIRPGPVVFASLFALDSMARATLSTVIPLQAYAVLGSARNVSLLFFAVGWVGHRGDPFCSRAHSTVPSALGLYDGGRALDRLAWRCWRCPVLPAWSPACS
jgi:hypothetical protein